MPEAPLTASKGSQAVKVGQWLSGRLRGLTEAYKGSQKDVEVKIPLKATMGMTVKRFQGVYECGCEAHPLDGPENCEIHDKPKKYEIEETQEYEATVREEE